MLPTVRVAHPLDPNSFMTINATDYRELVHGPLWPEQAEGFRGLPAPKPQQLDPAVRDLACTLMLTIMDLEASQKGQPLFSTLSPEQQLAKLREGETEIRKSQERMASYQRDMVADQQRKTDAETKAREAAEAAQQAADTLSGERVAGQDAAPAAPAPNAVEQPAAAPTWATNPATPAPQGNTIDPLTVSKGPGNKWYVMRGNSPVSEGFATKAEAEAKKAEIGTSEG